MIFKYGKLYIYFIREFYRITFRIVLWCNVLLCHSHWSEKLHIISPKKFPRPSEITCTAFNAFVLHVDTTITLYIYLWYRDGVVLYFSSYLNVTGCCDLVVDMLWSSCINTRHRWSETIESSWICHDIANAFLPVGCWWICHPDFYLKFEVTSIKDRVKIIVDHKKNWQIISANFEYICLQKIVLQKNFF